MFHTHTHTHTHTSFKSIFTSKNLLKAYFSCRRGKRKTINALKFEARWESKLLALQKKLQNHSYRPGRSICFVVAYPKIREVFAADFTDRVVHHLLINKIEPHFERRFIYNSFACRKEKGCHTAVSHLRKFIGKISKNKTQNVFYGQFDIKSFFSKIDKNTLLAILEKEIKKITRYPENKNQKNQNDILWLAKTIIFHDPTQNYYLKGKKEFFDQIPAHKTLFKTPKNKGLPIGNLTNQFFANVYLNELDQFVKRKLKVKYYLRYVDDVVLLSKNLKQLEKWREEIGHFLKQNLKL